MATEIKVPVLGESVTEGTIAEWLKQPGEAVAADEPICSLETDKVAVDVPSPVAGVMSQHMVAVGDTVVVGAVIAIIEAGATAGAAPAAAPVAKNCDFPLDPRFRITANANLQIVDGEKVIADAWTAGDISAVPDLSGGGVGGYCVPNAQHAVRQAKLLAKNIAADIRGELPREYLHKNLGAVAGLGIGVGAFQSGKIGITGFVAWVMHRGYHGLAMPMWERKIRVFSGWIWNFLLRRDIVAISATKDPRLAFETFASRPKA